MNGILADIHIKRSALCIQSYTQFRPLSLIAVGTGTHKEVFLNEAFLPRTLCNTLGVNTQYHLWTFSGTDSP